MKRSQDPRYRLLFETIPDPVLVWDARTRSISDANPALLLLLGYTLSELVGRSLGELELSENEPPALGFERRVLLKTGERRAFLIDAHLGRDGEDEFIHYHLRTKTVPVAAERSLELKELIVQMEAFSYTMAHDLRGPLRTMQGYAQILREDYGAVLDQTARDYLNLISIAARRMHKLVTDVLIYTRMTAESSAMIPVPIEPLIGSLVAEFPALTAALRIRSELPVIWGDPAALTRAFANVLSNALKFMTPAAPPVIELFALTDGAWTTIYFADNGIGIPERDQERIFRMFERIHASNIDEGAGIGLAIVRKAVARMGGTVGVESNPGQGSTFWIRLRHYEAPVAPGDGSGAVLPVAEKELVR